MAIDVWPWDCVQSPLSEPRLCLACPDDVPRPLADSAICCKKRPWITPVSITREVVILDARGPKVLMVGSAGDEG